MTWSWRTGDDGYVWVDRGNGPEVIDLTEPAYRDPTAPSADTDRVAQWLGLAEQASAKYDVPLPWILGVIYAESRGYPDVDNAPECGGTGCVGLMQIHWALHKQSREDMLDPAKNIDYGTSLLAQAIACGADLPTTASMYNAGPARGGCTAKTSTKSPWGMVENVGYIERVVRAANWFRAELAGRDVPPTPPEPTPSSTASSALKKLVWTALGLVTGWSVLRHLRRRPRTS